MKTNNKPGMKDSRKGQRRAGWRHVAAVLLLGAALLCVLLAIISYHTRGRWPRRLLPYRPTGIILHHSATDQRVNGQLIDAQFIDRMHARRGFNVPAGGRNYHIGYHYIIRGDGVVEPGRPEWMWGSHTRGHNDQLGICLIGDFSSGDNPAGRKGPVRPTKAQLDSLNGLLRKLSTKYGFEAQDIHRHRDYANTACPGDRFPFEKVVRRAF
jgi:N-acetyl-anhydromuramyl-L-alanine amidase AmpD